MTRAAAMAFVLIGFLWGSAWIPASEVLKQVPGLRAGAMRFAIAAVFTGLLELIARHRQRKTPTRFFAVLLRDALVLSMTALALPYALIAWAAPHILPAGIPALFAFMPLIALLMRRESAMDMIAALVFGISGVVLLIAQGLAFSLAQLGGSLFVFCAVVLGAFSLNYAGKHLRSSDLLVSSSIQFAFAAIFLGTCSLAIERTQWLIPSTATTLWLIVLGVLISGVSLPLLYWLLIQIEAWKAALLQWVSTLVAVTEAAWLLRARPTAAQAIAALSIVGSVLWLFFRSAPVTSPATILTVHGPNASDSEVGSE